MRHFSLQYYFDGDCMWCDLDIEHCDLSLDGCGSFHPHRLSLSRIREIVRAAQ